MGRCQPSHVIGVVGGCGDGQRMAWQLAAFWSHSFDHIKCLLNTRAEMKSIWRYLTASIRVSFVYYSLDVHSTTTGVSLFLFFASCFIQLQCRDDGLSDHRRLNGWAPQLLCLSAIDSIYGNALCFFYWHLITVIEPRTHPTHTIKENKEMNQRGSIWNELMTAKSKSNRTTNEVNVPEFAKPRKIMATIGDRLRFPCEK